MYSDKHLLLVSLLTLLLLPVGTTATKKWNISAIFAFGDSLVDPGNNNGLRTICRSNHRPYGMNLRNHVPTGRFSDGKLALDFLISALGIKKSLPAYSDVTDQELLTGASFGSACSGIDGMTSMMSGTLSLPQQLANFHRAFDRIRALLGQDEAGKIIEDSLFVIAAGSNDVVYNLYMMPNGSMIRNVGEYHDMMLRSLESIITRLVGMGAVRMAVMGLPPVGCLPLVVTMNSMNSEGKIVNRECAADKNADSEAYNRKLQSIITRLQASVRRSNIVYADIYKPLMHILRNPKQYGFQRRLEGCCGSGAIEMGPMCNARSGLCRNPARSVFFDAAHPTEATHKIYAKYFQSKVLTKLMQKKE